MKQLFSLVLAGIIGGLITLGGYSLLQPDTLALTQPEAYAQAVKNVNLPVHANAFPFDFKEAAAKAMPAVVHISATMSRTARNNGSDPFRFFSGMNSIALLGRANPQPVVPVPV